MSKIVGIIPCAGYGTRMNMPINKSKEMLEDLVTGKYLIDYSLDLCYKYNIDPVVISRLEKEDLNAYLRSKEIAHIVLKTPGKEWAETVLKSQGLWGDKNILLLPDVRFKEESIIPEMIKGLDIYTPLAIATHKIDVNDSEKWGTVDYNCIHEKQPSALDKAWGILGWRNFIGEKLFKSLTPQGTYMWNYNFEGNPLFYNLDKFVDITRSGKLEKY